MPLFLIGPAGQAERRVPAPAELIAGNYSIGKEDAPVTIVEFSDFQCYYCRKFTLETLPAIRKEYVDSGKVRFFFSDFPLTSIHPQAVSASVAARCAGRQQKFWSYHDKLFTYKPRALKPAVFEKIARELSLDLRAYRTCVADREVRAEVLANQDRGAKAGVRGTPAFVILSPQGGKMIAGAYPIHAFRKIIEAELKAAQAKRN